MQSMKSSNKVRTIRDINTIKSQKNVQLWVVNFVCREHKSLFVYLAIVSHLSKVLKTTNSSVEIKIFFVLQKNPIFNYSWFFVLI